MRPALAALLLWVAAGTAHAQDLVGTDQLALTADEVRAAAADLASDDEAARTRAIATLSTLGEEALPAIHERIATFGRARMDEARMYHPLLRLRRAVGSLRADDDLDIAAGIPAALRQHRDRDTVRVIEMVLLLRALEAMGTLEGGRAIVALHATSSDGWGWEMRRVVRRMGARCLAALIEAGNHGDRRVRSWARWGVRENGVRTVGDAVQQRDNAVLAGVLRAYGTVRDFEAMRVVVSLVTSERAQVRDAARWATEQYGRNAVWQLREKYKNLTGNEAERGWGWRRVADELYRVNDDARLGPVRADLEAGLAAQQSGDFAEMEAKFDSVLARAPTLPRRHEMAAGYAALARRRMQARDYRSAARAMRRATWLAADPDAPEARAARADLTFIEAELTRASGVLDVPSYREAVALAPEHERATAVLERVTGDPTTRGATDSHRRWLLAAAGIALALVAVALLRPRRRKSAAAPPGPPADEITDPSASAPILPDEAADTLPG